MQRSRLVAAIESLGDDPAGRTGGMKTTSPVAASADSDAVSCSDDDWSGDNGSAGGNFWESLMSQVQNGPHWHDPSPFSEQQQPFVLAVLEQQVDEVVLQALSFPHRQMAAPVQRHGPLDFFEQHDGRLACEAQPVGPASRSSEHRQSA